MKTSELRNYIACYATTDAVSRDSLAAEVIRLREALAAVLAFQEAEARGEAVGAFKVDAAAQARALLTEHDA